MQRPYIHDDFLLRSDVARQLFHERANALPIVDFHTHLDPQWIASDHRFKDLTELWLDGDHYKWRAMRTNGVGEEYCTGGASSREKFDRWAATVPALLRNQLYPWTHLELARIFGWKDALVDATTADRIWHHCMERLAEPSLSARGMLRRFRVDVVCTTDDPTDSLDAHQQIRNDPTIDVLVLPTFRPDRAFAIDQPESFRPWIGALGARVNLEIETSDDLLTALASRLEVFVALGGRLTDHGLTSLPSMNVHAAHAQRALTDAMNGARPKTEDIDAYRSWLLLELGRLNHAHGMTQQFHLGATRNNNTRMFELVGPDAGFDAMGEHRHVAPLARLFDALDQTGQLAKTIVYNIHPSQNASLVALLGCFEDGSVPGKMQLGSGWWFNDQIDGMESQLNAYSQNGLLRHFVGMLSDSRSFASFPRHEYFRRILCALIGHDVERGLLPHDLDLLGDLVEVVSYGNAARHFGFELDTR